MVRLTTLEGDNDMVTSYSPHGRIAAMRARNYTGASLFGEDPDTEAVLLGSNILTRNLRRTGNALEDVGDVAIDAGKAVGHGVMTGVRFVGNGVEDAWDFIKRQVRKFVEDNGPKYSVASKPMLQGLGDDYSQYISATDSFISASPELSASINPLKQEAEAKWNSLVNEWNKYENTIIAGATSAGVAAGAATGPFAAIVSPTAGVLSAGVAKETIEYLKNKAKREIFSAVGLSENAAEEAKRQENLARARGAQAAAGNAVNAMIAATKATNAAQAAAAKGMAQAAIKAANNTVEKEIQRRIAEATKSGSAVSSYGNVTGGGGEVKTTAITIGGHGFSTTQIVAGLAILGVVGYMVVKK